ncbi:MAG: flagellar basal body rod protein FlgC [Desulfobacteraceae bacterium]|jgi:flagellar basal-body rod protein FlgC|nr:flagellar basal body rod protein FlgC [Desulfobacteraceae bacterium]MBC2752894.1 flagellar basal body rod protein FlgC [Desulfobacteraceae bacterium]
MGFLDALQASASGLSAQRVRMRLIANNLANMHTTRTPEGGPYQRREPIFAAESPDNATFHDMLKAQQEGGVVEVRTVDIIKDGRDPIRKYEPDHPDADETGFISLPNISVTEEMVNLVSASRSYEANVAAVKATKNMVMKALEIGR